MKLKNEVAQRKPIEIYTLVSFLVYHRMYLLYFNSEALFFDLERIRTIRKG